MTSILLIGPDQANIARCDGGASREMGQWAMIVLTACFGGRSIEKVARILNRK